MNIIEQTEQAAPRLFTRLKTGRIQQYHVLSQGFINESISNQLISHDGSQRCQLSQSSWFHHQYIDHIRRVASVRFS